MAKRLSTADQLVVERVARGQHAPLHEAKPLPWFAPVSRVRAVVAVTLFVVGGIFFAFPGWALLLFPAGALAAQCLRRSDVARWTVWSVTLAAFMAEATVPLTWELRFGALLLLIGPILFYAGSVFRAI
jgi:hypothetical protein